MKVTSTVCRSSTLRRFSGSITSTVTFSPSIKRVRSTYPAVTSSRASTWSVGPATRMVVWDREGCSRPGSYPAGTPVNSSFSGTSLIFSTLMVTSTSVVSALMASEWISLPFASSSFSAAGAITLSLRSPSSRTSATARATRATSASGPRMVTVSGTTTGCWST